MLRACADGELPTGTKQAAVERALLVLELSDADKDLPILRRDVVSFEGPFGRVADHAAAQGPTIRSISIQECSLASASVETCGTIGLDSPEGGSKPSTCHV